MERTAGFVPGRGEGAGAQHRQRGRRGWGADGDAAPWRACWVPTRPPRTFGTRRGRSDSSRATCAAGGK
jgi:hypothetical protein